VCLSLVGLFEQLEQEHKRRVGAVYERMIHRDYQSQCPMEDHALADEKEPKRESTADAMRER
jgi:hypothetical protein